MFGRFLDWFERHKFGVVGALMLHTLMLFAFAIAKLNTGEEKNEVPEQLTLEMEAPPPEPPQLTPEQQQQQAAAGAMKSRISDLNADPERSLSRSTREHIAQDVEQQLHAEEQAEFQRLAEERTAAGEDIVVPTLDPSKFDKNNYLKPQPKAVKVEGNVAVRINVPGRQNTTVDIPAYLCKGRGLVLVRVTVDRNGDVSKAEVDPSASNTADACLLDHAVESARGARFDRSASGSASSGTIEYTFQAQ